MIHVTYKVKDNFIGENGKVNVVLASFTTAHARIELHKYLLQLQDRVVYYDTDSIIFISQEGMYTLQIFTQFKFEAPQSLLKMSFLNSSVV